MENDAPVVGPDAPTVNPKVIKLDIGTADWNPVKFRFGVVVDSSEWAIPRSEALRRVMLESYFQGDLATALLFRLFRPTR